MSADGPGTQHQLPPPRGRQRTDEGIIGSRVEAACERWSAYGYRRVTHGLRREGLVVNHKRVARIMRERGLKAYPRDGTSSRATAQRSRRFRTLHATLSLADRTGSGPPI